MRAISTPSPVRPIFTWAVAVISLSAVIGCGGGPEGPEYLDPPDEIVASFEAFIMERLPLVDSLMRAHPHRWGFEDAEVAGPVRIEELDDEPWLFVERMPADAPPDHVHAGVVAIEVPLRPLGTRDEGGAGEAGSNPLYLEFLRGGDGRWVLLVHNGFPTSTASYLSWALDVHDFHPRVMAGLLDIFPETVEYWDTLR